MHCILLNIGWLVDNSIRKHHTNNIFAEDICLSLFSSFVCNHLEFPSFRLCLSISMYEFNFKGSIAVSALLNGKFFYSLFGVLHIKRARDSTHGIFIKFSIFFRCVWFEFLFSLCCCMLAHVGCSCVYGVYVHLKGEQRKKKKKNFLKSGKNCCRLYKTSVT